MSDLTPSTPEPPPLDTEELRLLAAREADAQRKRLERAQTALERAQAADAPPAVKLPPMPASLRQIRRWLRLAYDQYENGQRKSTRLDQARAHARAVADMFKASAEIRKAEAMIRGAQAQERMAELLASFEHGGAVVGLLASLRAGDGLLVPRPRLPRPTTPLRPVLPADGEGA